MGAEYGFYCQMKIKEEEMTDLIKELGDYINANLPHLVERDNIDTTNFDSMMRCICADNQPDYFETRVCEDGTIVYENGGFHASYSWYGVLESARKIIKKHCYRKGTSIQIEYWG